MKKLAPGIYDDQRGGMHLDLRELLIANGFADTLENHALMEKTWREWCAAHHVSLSVTETAIVIDVPASPEETP